MWMPNCIINTTVSDTIRYGSLLQVMSFGPCRSGLVISDLYALSTLRSEDLSISSVWMTTWQCDNLGGQSDMWHRLHISSPSLHPPVSWHPRCDHHTPTREDKDLGHGTSQKSLVMPKIWENRMESYSTQQIGLLLLFVTNQTFNT